MCRNVENLFNSVVYHRHWTIFVYINFKNNSNWRNWIIISLGKSRVDALLTESIEAINYLESNPITTDDFVAYIIFVDQAQQKVDRMEAELDYIKELYDIMEEHQIPVPAVDVANYLVQKLILSWLFCVMIKLLELIYSWWLLIVSPGHQCGIY